MADGKNQLDRAWKPGDPVEAARLESMRSRAINEVRVIPPLKMLRNGGLVTLSMGGGDGKTGDQIIFAKITGSALDGGVYYHAWTQQVRTETGFENYPDGLSGTVDVDYAIQPDGSEMDPGTYVALAISVNNYGEKAFTIMLGGGGGGGGGGNSMEVLLSDGAGEAGSQTVRTNLHYTVKALDGTVIASNVFMTGNGQRIVQCTMTAGTRGRGYFDPTSGYFILTWADETAEQNNCDLTLE